MVLVRFETNTIHKNRLINPYSNFLLKGIINTGGNGNLAADRIGPKPVLQGFTIASAERFLVSIYSAVQLQMFVFP